MVVVQCQRWQVSSQVLRAIVIEVVVGGRQVGIQRVEVAGLLDAVPNRRELIGKVLATGVGGVEIALDDEGETTAQRGGELSAHACCDELGRAV